MPDSLIELKVEAERQAGGKLAAAQGQGAEGFNVVANAFERGHAAVNILEEDGLAFGESAAG